MLAAYYKLSFQTKIQAAFIVLIVLAVSLTGGGAYWLASNIVQSNAEKSGQEAILRTKQVLDERMRHIAISVMTLMFSDVFKDTVRDVSLYDYSNYYKLLSSMQPVFAQIKLNEPLTQSVLISTPMGDFYETGNTRNVAVPFLDSELHRLHTEAKTDLWVGGHVDPYFASHQQVISLVMKPITNVDQIYIVVNVLESSFKDVMRANQAEGYDDMILIQPDGSEVLQSSPRLWKFQMENNKPMLTTSNESDYILSYTDLNLKEGWTLVSVQSKSKVLQQLNRIKWIMISVAAGCILVALLVSRMLMTFLMKPLHHLRTLMKRAESNDLKVRFASPYSDEFSLVGERFNRMLEQISSLNEMNERIYKEKSKAEVKALQAQISPHFLYNTLNTIYWKNKMKQSQKVGDMVLSLSRMFQLGLNGGNEMTTLGNELTHVEQYLLLQQSSYENLFRYEIAVEEESLRLEPVLKLWLQPLVENSILHGFKNRREGGIIRIAVRKQDGCLICTVGDNGRGMDARTIKQRLSDPRLAENGHGYALRNIDHRLKLYYGEQASMTFESVPDEGTVITLQIPLGGD
ncbi:sensor histidine kinase [Cohnella cellulosilytica]|uniref:Sensor histidine kinase n=1 Tax=Cohnella cellulosilytica TaxID=986710 RepID=A0ABW2FHA1_9BACL